MPVSEKYFLEVSPHVSLKVIKDSVRDLKNLALLRLFF